MATVEDLMIKIEADTQRLRSELARGEKAVADSTSAMDKALGKLAGAFSGLGAVVGKLMAVLAPLLALFSGAELVRANAEFQSLNASLRTVTGSASAAGAAMARLQVFAKETPFSLSQVVEGFIKLKALGLDPGIDSLRSYGNTAAAMNKDVMQFIEAVADAATGEFERLKEFGITASAEGQKIKFTFQNVTNTVGKNSAEIQQYLRQIGNVQFAGAMALQMDTLKGAWSNLTDTIDQFFVAIGKEGVNDALKSALQDITAAVDTIAAKVPAAASYIRAAWDQVDDSLSAGGSAIASAARDAVALWYALQPLATVSTVIERLVDAIEAVAAGFVTAGQASGWIDRTAAGFEVWANSPGWEALRAGLEKTWAGIVNIGLGFQIMASEAFKAVGLFLSGMGQMTAGAGRAVDTTVNTFRALGIFIAGVATGTVSAWSSTFDDLTSVSAAFAYDLSHIHIALAAGEDPFAGFKAALDAVVPPAQRMTQAVQQAATDAQAAWNSHAMEQAVARTVDGLQKLGAGFQRAGADIRQTGQGTWYDTGTAWGQQLVQGILDEADGFQVVLKVTGEWVANDNAYQDVLSTVQGWASNDNKGGGGSGKGSQYAAWTKEIQATTASLGALALAQADSTEAVWAAEVAMEANKAALQYGVEKTAEMVEYLTAEKLARAALDLAKDTADLRAANDAQGLLNEATARGTAALYEAEVKTKLLAAARQLGKSSLDALTDSERQLLDAYEAQIRLQDSRTQVSDQLAVNTELTRSVSLLQAEVGLIGASAAARERQLALIEAQLDYQDRIVKATGDDKTRLEAAYAETVRLTNQYYDLNEEVQRTEKYLRVWQDALDDIGASFKDFFSDIRKDGLDAFEDLAAGIADALSNLQADLLYNAVLNVITTGSTGSASASGSAATVTGSDGAESSTSASLSNVGSTMQTVSLVNALTGNSSSSSIGTNIASSLGLTTTETLTDVIPGLTDALGTTTEMLSSTGQFLADGINGMTTLGGSIGSLLGGFASDLVFGDMFDSVEASIGGTIGSSLGSFIGAALLSEIPVVGTFLGAFAGDALGSVIGDMFADVQTPRGGAGFYITESGQISTSATWGLDGVDEQEMIDLADGVSTAFNTILDALDTSLSYSAMDVPVQLGYEDGSGYYTSQTVDGAEIRTAYDSMEQAVIGLVTDLLGYTTDALPAEVQTALATIDTTDPEYFTELVVLAASWQDLLDQLSGTIDYQSSILATVQDEIDAYQDELSSLQDMAADAGLSVSDLNAAYEDSLLTLVGLRDGGDAALTDLETAFWETVYGIQESAQLFEQIGYGWQQTANVISDALTAALETFQADFAESIATSLNSLTGKDYLNSFDDYIAAYEESLSYADLIRADTASLTALWQAMLQDVLSGATDMGTALADLTAAYPDYTAALWDAYTAVVDTTDLLASAYAALGDDLTGTLLAFDAETTAGAAQYAGADLLLYQSVREAERAQAVYDYYAGLVEDSIDTYEDLIDSNSDLIEALYSLRDTAADLRLNQDLAPGSLADLLAEAESQYQAALTEARDLGLPTEDRIAAIEDVNSLVATYLGYAREYYGSSLAYSQIFGQTQADLIGLGEGQIAELEAANDNVQAQIDALQAIDDSITSASAAAQLSAAELQALIAQASADLSAALGNLDSTVASYNAGTLYTGGSSVDAGTAATVDTATATETAAAVFDQAAYDIVNAPYSAPYQPVDEIPPL